MTKYKRWILLLTALTVFVVHVESLKATSLIHAGKFTKLLNTTTSTTTQAPPKDPKEMLDEMPDEESYVEVNGTKIALTGIPQIDYVWDPNLPRELNGFNLSHYPFLDSMPADEDIGFDCDDKINGYYASIKFGCQLYHHCLYGVRSSFICANFTAFDQKTFICHFASEVDCKNSYKYWSRNDDLYKATTEKPTTAQAGLAPLFDRNLYRRPAPGSSPTNGATKIAQQPSSHNGDLPLAPLPLGNLPTLKKNINNPSNNNHNNNNNPPVNNAGTGELAPPVGSRPVNRPLRRPYRRRRPQIDYYYYDDEYEDDFYDDRGRRRQQRPRNRRPIYDDYDSRRPDRRPLDDDFDDYEYDRRPYRSRNRSESRRNGDDRRKTEDRQFDDRRRPYNEDRKPVEDRRRPDDERRSYDDRRPDDRRQTDDRKRQDEERGQSGDRKSNRRRNQDDTVDDRRRERVPEREEPTEKRQVSDDPLDDKVVKSSTSLFDRPRPSPKIARPVLLSEKNKYSIKQVEKSAVDNQKKKDDEYYEEYDDPIVSSTITTTTSTTPKPVPTTKGYSPRLRTLTSQQTTKKPSTTVSTTTVQEIEYYEDEDYENLTPPPPKLVESSTIAKPLDRSALFNSRNRQIIEPLTISSTTLPTVSAPDNFRLNRFKSPNEKLINETAIRDNAQKTNLPYVEETSPSSSPSSTSRKPLPSISYNKKFANKQTEFEPTSTETTKTSTEGETFDIDQRILLGQYNEQSEPAYLEERDQKYVMRIIKRPFLPSRGGNPYKARGLLPVGPASHEPTVDINNQQLPTGSEVSPPANPNHEDHKTTLEDIYNEEYDVELNDALNPMLKPLTSSRGISGFSFSSLPNDDKDGYRSQSRQVIQRTDAPKAISEQPQYEYEEVEYDYK